MKPWSVLPANGSHAAAMAAITRGQLDSSWDQPSFKALLDLPSTTACVAVTADGEVLGMAIGRGMADEAELLLLAVAEHVRRHGVGAALLKRLVEAFDAFGAHNVYLEVAADNDPALALYRAAGFSQIGVRKGYYARRNGLSADALLLSLCVVPATHNEPRRRGVDA